MTLVHDAGENLPLIRNTNTLTAKSSTENTVGKKKRKVDKMLEEDQATFVKNIVGELQQRNPVKFQQLLSSFVQDYDATKATASPTEAAPAPEAAPALGRNRRVKVDEIIPLDEQAFKCKSNGNTLLPGTNVFGSDGSSATRAKNFVANSTVDSLSNLRFSKEQLVCALRPA